MPTPTQNIATETEQIDRALGIVTKPGIAREFDVTTRTIEVWMKEGRIPYYRIGRTVRFNLAQVVAHLDANSRVGGRR